jgi:2-polyprenyl-3-methyl-5-hydroxy-6-metoxy-1,4-benzoquinol methylase
MSAFDENYFRTGTYARVSFGRFSQYWWSNRFYAILARRYGRRGGDLLEVGCGLGHLVAQLATTFRTSAVDVNRHALGEARAVAPRTGLHAAAAERLPFAAASFDVVIIKHIIEHLPVPALAVAELGRVLRPNGTLIFSTPNLGSLLRPLKGKRWIGYQDPTHISLKSPEEWLAMLRDVARVSIVRAFADGFWDVPYVSVVPAALQRLVFGSLGGLQAISGFVFLPQRWGESIIIVARKRSEESTR